MVKGEENIRQEGEGDYKERLGDMAVDQETARQSHKAQGRWHRRSPRKRWLLKNR